MDPLAEEYPDQSPFLFCSENPVMRVDMNGMGDGWVEDPSNPTKGVYWDPMVNNKKQADSKGLNYKGQTVFATNQNGEFQYGDANGQWHGSAPLDGVTITSNRTSSSNPAGQGGAKLKPLLTINLNRGIPQIETNFTDKDWGAITPGPFIVYPKGGSKDKYYKTHEPGHVIQFLILGPVAYYGLVAIPSLISSTTPYHSEMPWEKSANQLWYWLTGENDPRNPLYFKPKK